MEISGTTAVAVAIMCHEANRAFCAFLGDDSQKPWSEAPDWQRASAVNGVNFHAANPDAGDAASHDSWMREKVAAGWVYGETKDEQAKTHPCIVPFEQLPADQQFKDRLFRTIVHAALDGDASAGGIISALSADISTLGATLTATKGHATRARNDAAVLRAEKSPEARKLGRPVARFGKPGPAYSPELAAIAIGEMDNVEIVFSDGKAEIVALAPVTAWPQAWLPRGGRHMLREPVELEGGDAEAEVAGVALVSAGEQIGWCEFPEPVRLPKYGRVRLENCITF